MAEEYRHLSFLRFSFFLFIFLKTKKKSKEQVKSSPLFPLLFSFSFRVPGVFGVFDPSCLREKYTYSFFRGKWNQKTNGVRDTDICLFAAFPSLFFSGASPRFGVQDAFGPHNAGKAEVFFSKRKRQRKRKMTTREGLRPF